MDGDDSAVEETIKNKAMVFERWVSDEAMDLIYQMNRKLVKNRISLDKVGQERSVNLLGSRPRVVQEGNWKAQTQAKEISEGPHIC